MSDDASPCRGCPAGTVCSMRAWCESGDPVRLEMVRRANERKARQAREPKPIAERPAKPKAKPKAKPAPLLTPADLPCVHRGDLAETVDCVPCRSRGQTGAAVYGCRLYGRCMMENFSARDPSDNATACKTCEARSEGWMDALTRWVPKPDPPLTPPA